ncbi:MAG: flavin-containing monooxygenase [Micromonosporaceae bacterium]
MNHSTPPPVSVVIVGTGFSGLAMAIQLAKDAAAGGPDDYVVIEKADDVGGTWRENTYPGCSCDVQSHLYSYSFAQNPRWSRMFAQQQEIWDYLRRCVDRYGLRPHIRFGTELASAEFDDETGLWRVETAPSAATQQSPATGSGDDPRPGGLITARAVVLAKGPLHQPRHPDVPGMDSFAGRAFHSADWDHTYDVTGKRVAVIGTGASSIQFLPRIARQAAAVTLVQRTPAWVMPKLDRKISKTEQRWYAALPALQRLYRATIYWRNEIRVLGMHHPKAMRVFEAIGRRHIRRHVTDPELARKLTPDFAVGCKRILISNDYYPALARDNVHVVTDGLARVTRTGIVTADGVEHPVDAIIYGTGFHVSTGFEDLRITGRHGVKLRDVWAKVPSPGRTHEGSRHLRKGPEAYLGTTVAGFPNLFLMLGPNSGLGHSSMVFMAEAQARYISDGLRLLRRTGARHLEVRGGVQERFNDVLQRKLSGAVWATGGCRSWYVDADGRNRTLWPGFTFSYWWRTRRLNPADYVLTH